MQHKGKTNVFTRLIIYFMVVMIIPLLILISTMLYYNNSNITKLFEEQAITALDANAREIEDIFENYRHRIYALSKSEAIISILKADSNSSEYSRAAYSALFSAMEGSQSLAEASIVSESGRVRLSTHVFPELYDLRINSNEWNQTSIFYGMKKQSAEKEKATVITLQTNRVSEEGKSIFATLIRRIYSDDGDAVGYAIIDIYTDTLVSSLYSSSFFSEEILIDNSSYTVLDLLQPYQALYKKKYKASDRAYTYPSVSLLNGDFTIEATIDLSAYSTSQSRLFLILIAVIAIGILISTSFAVAFSRSISKRISGISRSMKSVADGNLSASIDKKSLGHSEIKEFSELADAINSMTLKLKELMELTREEEEKLREAEKKELEEQLNPHFLFNTLNTIKALASLHHETDIYTISVKLSYLLRDALRNHSGECSIRESLDLTESYLMIQKIRFKDKISYDIECDPDAEEEIAPRLIIQPFVENAVIHGLEPKTDPGNVSIRVRSRDRRIEIMISDNGIGFNAEGISSNMSQLAGSGHVGMYNVYRRLEMKYGNDFSFSLRSMIGEGTEIIFSFPMEDIDEL
mgnify:CR=1 FL=1